MAYDTQSDHHITILCPPTYVMYSKISVIKAIRGLTNMGLKEAKDASEITTEQALPLSAVVMAGGGLNSAYANEHVTVLRSAGVLIENSATKILHSLRELATEALRVGDDELANEILQLVLVEKLRRRA